MNLTLPTAGLIVIKDNKLLLTFSKNKKAWYLPGGKIDANESAHDALCREISEELNIGLNSDLLKYYCHISAPAYGEEENVIMEQECFLYELMEEVEASSEIEQIGYFDLDDYLQQPIQVKGVLKVFKQLQEDMLLGESSTTNTLYL